MLFAAVASMVKNMSEKRKLTVEKRIALVAHDKKKKDLIEWCKHNRQMLSDHQLIATGTTGKLLEEELSLPIENFSAGRLVVISNWDQ